MKQFLISLLAVALLSLSSLSRAAQVHFHKHIDESCGIEVIKERGEIHFGRRFGSDSLTLKLLANNRDKRLYFRLSYFNIDMGAETISRNVFTLKWKRRNVLSVILTTGGKALS
ncbi:hypothetical protein JCM19052_2662 [Vibrio sp. JCM 19052]|nr:hypothetical protein JCM19052_2662 [Vibrio sp. JCM 19052]